jgi:hypothetical protein
MSQLIRIFLRIRIWVMSWRMELISGHRKSIMIGLKLRITNSRFRASETAMLSSQDRN